MTNTELFFAFIFVLIVLFLIIPMTAHLITKMICDAKSKSKIEFLQKLNRIKGDHHGKEERNEREG